MKSILYFILISLQIMRLVESDETDPSVYGVDHSYPIHHPLDDSSFYGKQYNELLQGCYERYSKSECDETERSRIEMNLDQPRTQHNYTDIGFKKMRAPAALWDPIIQFYELNKAKAKPEQWYRANTYTNNWVSPTTMISFEDRSLIGSATIKQEIWDAAKPIIEEWTGKKLVQTSLYGIRLYHDGAILGTHVDRLPLVSSCIINVAQDLDEPW